MFERIKASLERLRIPRALTSALLLLAIVSGLGWTAFKLSDDATELIASLPEIAQKFRQTMQRREHTSTKPATPMDQVQQAATELDRQLAGFAAADVRERVRSAIPWHREVVEALGIAQAQG